MGPCAAGFWKLSPKDPCVAKSPDAGGLFLLSQKLRNQSIFSHMCTYKVRAFLEDLGKIHHD